MKCIPVIIFCSAALYAADFVNGQAARAVIGQTTFTTADPNSSNTVLGAANGIAYAANTLSWRTRIFSGGAGQQPRADVPEFFQSTAEVTAELPYLTTCPVCVGTATVVLGQPDFITNTVDVNASQNNLRLPSAVASDGVHLVVADTYHNRVLIWNHLPTYSNAPADVVVGQANFADWQSLPLGTSTASSLRAPQGVWLQNGKLFVADTQNNRVLIWNSIPTSNGVAANVCWAFPTSLPIARRPWRTRPPAPPPPTCRTRSR